MPRIRHVFISFTALLAIVASALSMPIVVWAGFTPTPTDTPAPATATPTSTATPTDTPAPTQPPAAPTQPPAAPTQPPVVVDPLITKAVELERAQIGDIVRFTIVVTNPNTVDVPNVVVTDPLPSEVNFVSATTTQGVFAYDAATHTVTFDLGTLAPQQVVTMNLTTVVNERGQPPIIFRNGVVLSRDGQPGPGAESGPVQIVPGVMPTTGLPPDEGLAWPTWLLAVLAALLPALAGAAYLRRQRR